jgi:ATP-dependent RNA helicase DDX52/ROK1
MQSIPALLERRDLIGAAPTGSGKSGAFIIPALLLSSAPFKTFYAGASLSTGSEANNSKTKKNKKKNKKESKLVSDDGKSSREGEIRSLLLAPSRELAAQLHREVDRLGLGKPGGISTMLLSKSNVSHVIAGTAGGKNGLDVLVSTPLRLVDAVEKGLRLDSIRIVVLDEADRLLDAADGSTASKKHAKDDDDDSEDEIEKEEDNGNDQPVQKSGSSTTQTFLAQMDVILSAIPPSAVRALFSATVTPTVRSLAETVLRNPIDLRIAAPGSYGGANTDIEQELMFVGREEGKLLAMRQLKERGQLKPPCIVFVQSQDRAQALFAELLYEGMHVDVIHAGRSQSARDAAVAKFRKGETWVLICTDLVARGVDFRAVNMVINYDLPASGITYVHRIGRTGRAGRKGKAITLFTEADFDNLRTIANVMKQSGCKVEDWMLQLRKKPGKDKKKVAPRRPKIDTTPSYDKRKRNKKRQIIQQSKKRKLPEESA